MREAVVEIARMEGQLAACLHNSQVDYLEGPDYIFLDLDLGEMPNLDSCAHVESYGEKIWKALCAHTAIKSELAQIFLTSAPDTAKLRFLIKPPNAERLRWETLCTTFPTQFLALNGVCTVSRIAYAGNLKDPGVRAFSFPLKMAAFLSPAAVTAQPEFDAICEQVVDARAKGLSIECTIYLGEQDLLDSAQSMIDAKKVSGITVAAMPPDFLTIENKLKDSPVQLLHFFCHGIIGAGVRLLELATISDWDTGKKTGSVTLSIDRLNQVLLTTGTTWITVLNSCSGAKAVDQLHSMALTLAKGASPFAVGMAEPIDPQDATDFTKAFYSKLFNILQAGVGSLDPGQSAILDLAPTVVPARDVLHSKYKIKPPDAFGRWCLPVMYQRVAPLKVTAIPADMKRRIELVAGALRSLPTDAPHELRELLIETLDKAPAVPLALRPDGRGDIGVA